MRDITVRLILRPDKLHGLNSVKWQHCYAQRLFCNLLRHGDGLYGRLDNGCKEAQVLRMELSLCEKAPPAEKGPQLGVARSSPRTQPNNRQHAERFRRD